MLLLEKLRIFQSFVKHFFNESSQAPPFNDFPRWNNRIISNLLYYQTNYIASFLVFFLISSIFNSQDLVLGSRAF